MNQISPTKINLYVEMYQTFFFFSWCVLIFYSLWIRSHAFSLRLHSFISVLCKKCIVLCLTQKFIDELVLRSIGTNGKGQPVSEFRFNAASAAKYVWCWKWNDLFKSCSTNMFDCSLNSLKITKIWLSKLDEIYNAEASCWHSADEIAARTLATRDLYFIASSFAIPPFHQLQKNWTIVALYFAPKIFVSIRFFYPSFSLHNKNTKI